VSECAKCSRTESKGRARPVFAGRLRDSGAEVEIDGLGWFAILRGSVQIVNRPPGSSLDN
jgi:hypothetical protein